MAYFDSPNLNPDLNAYGVPGGLGSAEATWAKPNHGSAPYAEARKLSLRRLLQGALYGLAASPGAPGLAGLGRGFAFSSRQFSRAEDAAQEYAMKTQAAQAKAEEEASRQTDREARTKEYVDTSKAYRDHLLKLEQKKAEPYAKAPWYMDPQYKDTPEGKAAAAKAHHVAAGKGGKAPAAPKPMKFPRRIPVGKDKPTEQQIIDSIMESTDPNELSPYITGRGSADSESIRRAAQLRANAIMREGR